MAAEGLGQVVSEDHARRHILLAVDYTFFTATYFDLVLTSPRLGVMVHLHRRGHRLPHRPPDRAVAAPGRALHRGLPLVPRGLLSRR